MLKNEYNTKVTEDFNMANAAQALLDMKRTSDFLVCVDSDGCAFDT